MTNKKITPFDFLNSINFTKQDMMMDVDNEKVYNSFMVNRGLSYFSDTVVIANEMNRYHHLGSKLQYQFLLNIIRKRKRFSKWVKPDIEKDIDAVKEYYGYSNAKAKQILSLLTIEQLIIIKEKVSKGGKRR